VYPVKVADPLPTLLDLKAEEVDTLEKRGKYTISVVGCKQRGIFYVIAFVEVGFKVTCIDADQSVIKRLSRGNTLLGNREIESKLKSAVKNGQLTVTSEFKNTISHSDIIILTISPKIDSKKNPDYSETQSTCKLIGATLSRGSLVVYGGVAGFGFTEGVVKETLENTSGLKVGEDFGLAYNPIQDAMVPGAKLGSQELIVAARDKGSLNSAAVIFETIAKKGVRKISDVKTAESAALFSAAKRDVNIALANELAVFCENAGIDYTETLTLIVGDYGEKTAIPTVAEEENGIEAYLLFESAENLNTKLRLPTLARQVNEEMVRHAVNLTQDALRSRDKTLRRARIALLGTIKSGTGAAAFMELLETKGAKISRYDPQGSENELIDVTHSLKRTLNDTVEGTDCVVILTGADQLNRLNLKKLKAVMKPSAALVDLAGVVEPSKVEAEGFTYRGLGRGTRKK
jgi:UDP-N-acetyl-D-mannosaminuronic acid dehydrogenase